MPTENVYWDDEIYARLAEVTRRKVKRGDTNAKGKTVTIRDVIVEATKQSLPTLEKEVGIKV